MIDINTIIEQGKLSRKAIAEIKNQNRIFETTLQEAVKGAPNEDKKKIEEVRQLSVKAMNLAKEGKIEEAQNLINTFKDGFKNNK